MKLLARDADDMAVISSLLQDALVPPGDIEYLAATQTFVMAANRYRWEAAEASARGERILCGVAFGNVTAVRRRGLELRARGRFYSLLSVELVAPDGGEAGGQAVDLTFAGGAAIRLEITALSCTLEDFGEAWPAGWRPQHG